MWDKHVMRILICLPTLKDSLTYLLHLLIIYIYIYINQLELLLSIHQDVDTTVMKETLYQSHQDLVSFHSHQSKSLLRSASLSNTLYVLGTTSILLCKSMIYMTLECRSLNTRKQNISKHDVVLRIKEHMYDLFKNVHQRREKRIQCHMLHTYWLHY